jgi:hypothetical protein
MKRLTILVSLIALVAATSATAAGPADYRKTMNAICRAYTPKLKSAEDAMALATTGQRKAKFEAALRTYLQLGLKQNQQLEAVRVPTELGSQMKPLLTRMKKIDPHLFKALRNARFHQTKAARSQLGTILRMTGPMNGMLDAVGLIDCGSNQP